MSKPTDIRAIAAALYFLPVSTRTPLKFGRETLHSVTCCRASVTVATADGAVAEGWGETPFSVQWAWPSTLPIADRLAAMQQFAAIAAEDLSSYGVAGHPIEIGAAFQRQRLPTLRDEFDRGRSGEKIPYLAALIALSPLDIALHDAYGKLHSVNVYDTYRPEYMNLDLGELLEGHFEGEVSFRGKYPSHYLASLPAKRLPVWHLVGGLDPLDEELARPLIGDGYPETLVDWIAHDGLTCLKIKLKGDDFDWDLNRILSVAAIALPRGVKHLSVDFNCTVNDPAYVNAILDAIECSRPDVYESILYVEQPFPYDLMENQIDVRSIVRRKPLFLDESAHDWQLVRLGRALGWSGVCLKTCKSQTGSLLSLCWAKAHGMSVMVQDLTNPMLAQIPHVQLAAYADTICGVESNAMQFYPEASLAEARIHPGVYTRRNGQLDLQTIQGPGFGYRLDEIDRRLPEPAAEFRASLQPMQT